MQNRYVTAAALIASCAALAAPAAAGATTLTSQAPATYVAMGDSYSAGESISPYETGTATSTDTCDRSSQAYGALLSQSLGLSSNGNPVSGKFAFVACSGATTSDLLNTNHQDPEVAQVNALGSVTKEVSLTIGGNDIGFVNFVYNCLVVEDPFSDPTSVLGSWGCTDNPNSTLMSNANKALATLEGTSTATDYLHDQDGNVIDNSSGSPVQIYPLKTVLTQIAADAPNAQIYLGGYPEVFGSAPNDFSNEVSAYKQYGGTGLECDPDGDGLTMDYADTQVMNGFATTWDAYEQSLVSTLHNGGMKITYVAPAFGGHGNCDTDSVNSSGDTVFAQKWINWAIVPTAGSFHPDASGQEYGYEQPFATAGL